MQLGLDILLHLMTNGEGNLLLPGYEISVLLHIPRPSSCSTAARIKRVHLGCLHHLTWVVFRAFHICFSTFWDTFRCNFPSLQTMSVLFQTDTQNPGTFADMSIKREVDDGSDGSSSDSDDGYDNDHATAFADIPNSKTTVYPVRGTYTRWGPSEAFRELVQNWYGHLSALPFEPIVTQSATTV